MAWFKYRGKVAAVITRWQGTSAAPQHDLLEALYGWERRTRGYDLYGAPVQLEPAFLPFDADVSAPPLAFDYAGPEGTKTFEIVKGSEEPGPAARDFLSGVIGDSVNREILFEKIEEYLREPTDPAQAVKVKFLREEIRKWRAKTSETLSGNSGAQQVELYSLIWGLSELAYSYMQKAKYWRFRQLTDDNFINRAVAHGPNAYLGEFIPIHLSQKDERRDTREDAIAILDLGLNSGENSTPSELFVLKRWSLVSALCWSCTELCRALRPEFASHEAALKIKCYTLYGLSLSHLNRFSEAHRRLNEAHALIPRSRSGVQGHELTCLHLRRAEVYLNQAERELVRPDKKWAKFFAHIDDGWCSLERAENSLSGSSHSSVWWGQLYSLKLRTFSLFAHLPEYNFTGGFTVFDLARRTMPFRRRIQYDQLIKEIVESALLTYNGNTYREYRICWYYSQIAEAFQKMGIAVLPVPFDPVRDALSRIETDPEWEDKIAPFVSLMK